MKNQLTKTLFLLTIILTAYSCSDDDTIGQAISNPFTIHASEIAGFSGDRYIMATAPLTGEVLYWDANPSFTDNITFDAGDNETVDVTFASEFNSSFSIKTYRDVESEFRVSGFLNPCYEGQYSADEISGKSVDIILPGTEEIVEISNPAYNREVLEAIGNVTIDQEKKIVYDLENDITIISALVSGAKVDHQFAFRFLGEQEYKSIVVKREEWIMVDEENYKIELEMEDLKPCTVHEIAIGIDETWIVNADVLTSTGDRIAIAKWSNFSQNQTGESISIFLQNDLEVDELLLKVQRNDFYNGFQFQNNFDNIPTSIALEEFTNELEDITANTYNYSTDDSHDLVKTTYRYLNDNYQSSWEIYQRPSSTLDYKLPEIESEFLDGTTVMQSSLPNPFLFTIQFYAVDADINQAYHETGINRQLQCLGFNSSYSSLEL